MIAHDSYVDEDKGKKTLCFREMAKEIKTIKNRIKNYKLKLLKI